MESFFDQIHERRPTSSLKWNRFEDDIIPLWVADMDFQSPPSVIRALKERIDHGIFGYTLPPKTLKEAIVHHFQAHFQWNIKEDWIVFIPGLVSGLNLACRAIGNSGDHVYTFTPIYPPFLSAPELSDRIPIPIPLSHEDNKWSFPPKPLNSYIQDPSKLFLFCHPHNPTGRVWSHDELKKIESFILENDLVLCSDEVHSGLILDENKKHTPIASLSKELEEKTITLMSPSKTYNLPGLACSYAIIPNSLLRMKIKRTMEGIVPHVNVLGYTATEAALREGGQWHQEMLSYLRRNRDDLVNFFKNFPEIKINHIEATYLAWLDITQVKHPDPFQLFLNHGVALNNGKDFGDKDFLRLNFACSREILQKALKRIKKALKTLA